MRKCQIDGCDLPPRARGWCNGHYRRFQRWGDPLAGRPAVTPAPIHSHDGERKRCTKCGVRKPISEFYRRGGVSARYGSARPRPRCIACHLGKTEGEPVPREPRQPKHPQVRISVEEYQARVEAQGGLCSVCGRRPSEVPGRQRGLCVDHDHSTGRVRALLCNPCNVGLGMFGEDAKRLRAAILYLETHKEV